MKVTRLQRILSYVKRDKTFFVLLVTLIFTGIWSVIDVFLNTRASQIQIWYRYTAFSAEGYSRTAWTYSYNWSLVAILIVGLHIMLASKLLKSNYREISILVLGLGILLVIIANVSFNLITGLPH